MPYCTLCGHAHEVAYTICDGCGLPYRYDARATGLPDGWEACHIVLDVVQPLDADSELVCLEAVRIIKGEHDVVLKRSPPFVTPVWDYPDGPPPRLTPEQRVLQQELIRALEREGWTPATTNEGSPSRSSFWRRVPPAHRR